MYLLCIRFLKGNGRIPFITEITYNESFGATRFEKDKGKWEKAVKFIQEEKSRIEVQQTFRIGEEIERKCYLQIRCELVRLFHSRCLPPSLPYPISLVEFWPSSPLTWRLLILVCAILLSHNLPHRLLVKLKKNIEGSLYMSGILIWLPLIVNIV